MVALTDRGWSPGFTTPIVALVAAAFVFFQPVGEILAADPAHAQGFRTDARLFGKDTRGQLVGAHFEAEEGNRCAGGFFRLDPLRFVLREALGTGKGDVGGKAGLAHRRAAGEDQQVRLVQAPHLFIQAGEASRVARQMPA